jgi:hypothetical protein
MMDAILNCFKPGAEGAEEGGAEEGVVEEGRDLLTR